MDFIMCNFPLRRGEGVLIYHQAFCDNKLLENSQNSTKFLHIKPHPTLRSIAPKKGEKKNILS
jgi:hypothetical protein